MYARRPLCDGGYYEQFNRDNVFLVDLDETPITCITEGGIKTRDGIEHELDVLIFATGFDAVDGNYTRIRIRGRDGKTLKDHWAGGPTSFLGVSVAHFPNMFMVTGPQGPFCNIPAAIEAFVEFITATIKEAERISAETKRAAFVEPTEQSEQEWNSVCKKAVEGSLFQEAASWIFGGNVPGKPIAVRFYFGGLKNFRAELSRVMSSGYPGYQPFVPTPVL
jgi:cyclohexanone monooxygenase